jgi:hypothetical protein
MILALLEVDTHVRRAVQLRLIDVLFEEAPRIRVTVRDDDVVLTGLVPTAGARTAALELARLAPGRTMWFEELWCRRRSRSAAELDRPSEGALHERGPATAVRLLAEVLDGMVVLTGAIDGSAHLEVMPALHGIRAVLSVT